MKGISDYHRVKATHTDIVCDGFSSVRFWHIETVSSAVSKEINFLVNDYVERFTKNEPEKTTMSDDPRTLSVSVRYSRTGIKWMSFMVQARLESNAVLIAQDFSTRAYDMSTGQCIEFADLFSDFGNVWEQIADKVKKALCEYYPDDAHNEEAISMICRRENLEHAEFTLHGFSAVLHYPMRQICGSHRTIAEITLMYSEIRQFMTEQAYKETDNLAYYKACALTYDDGPDRGTSDLLDVLLETGSRATFFVVGYYSKALTNIIQREHDEGHAVGAHNWDHIDPNIHASTKRHNK